MLKFMATLPRAALDCNKYPSSTTGLGSPFIGISVG
jgi:hypothetical protein